MRGCCLGGGRRLLGDGWPWCFNGSGGLECVYMTSIYDVLASKRVVRTREKRGNQLLRIWLLTRLPPYGSPLRRAPDERGRLVAARHSRGAKKVNKVAGVNRTDGLCGCCQPSAVVACECAVSYRASRAGVLYCSALAHSSNLPRASQASSSSVVPQLRSDHESPPRSHNFRTAWHCANRLARQRASRTVYCSGVGD